MIVQDYREIMMTPPDVLVCGQPNTAEHRRWPRRDRDRVVETPTRSCGAGHRVSLWLSKCYIELLVTMFQCIVDDSRNTSIQWQGSKAD